MSTTPTSLRQIPITCSGHTRPVVDLRFSDVTPYSYFLISACKGMPLLFSALNFSFILYLFLESGFAKRLIKILSYSF
jgi:hypothetical protein